MSKTVSAAYAVEVADKEYLRGRNETIEECARIIEQWENDTTPRTYKDLIAAIRALKDKP